MKTITSIDNKLIKSIKKLFDDKKYRDATNLFVVESYKVVNQLITNKYEMRNVVISSDSKYLSEFKKMEKELVVLSPKIFDSLSNLKNSDGIMGIFLKKKMEFVVDEGNYVLLEKIQNPGNLGTIIRNCLAFNVKGVIITNDSVDIYNPIIIRSTMGAVFSIPIKFTTNVIDVINQFKDKKFNLFATALDSKAININTFTPPKNNLIIFGNEGSGISPNLLKLVNKILYIPISSMIDSLNVSIASGIILNKFNENTNH